MKVLLTGGAGYIGSHTAIVLLEQGYDVVIIDNLCNSNALVIDRIEELSGKKVVFYSDDVRDKSKLRAIFEREKIDVVIHFAGLKAVGESVQQPLRYYENNLVSTLTLLEVMQSVGVKRFVFSSSATVYGLPKQVPIVEDAPLSTTNPYGSTKLMIEEIIQDCAKIGSIEPIILRYFNPVGAHESGRIGEDPNGIPNNLVPFIAQVAVGRLDAVKVFGNDYETQDGTGVRDYIHVVDLAKGHVAAVKRFGGENEGARIYNLGSGHGYSVLEVIEAFSRVSGKQIPFSFEPRRAGDIAVSYADATKAEKELNWKAEKTLDDMCADTWRWQQENPNGYR